MNSQAEIQRDIGIAHAGTKTFHSEEEGDFIEREVVECRCDTMDDARDIGKVVSLLNRHDADAIAGLVENHLEVED